ncbi:salivary C-type lectin 1-like [Glandiceps talaboti]
MIQQINRSAPPDLSILRYSSPFCWKFIKASFIDDASPEEVSHRTITNKNGSEVGCYFPVWDFLCYCRTCSLNLGNGDCVVYGFFCEQDALADRKYYNAAEDFCADQGGRLAVLDSKLKDDAVRNYIIDHDLDGPPCIKKKGFWFGLSDRGSGSEGAFKWAGGEVYGAYTNWAGRNPNNNTKRNSKGQDCVQLWFRKNKFWGQWDDDYCNYRPKGFVCEIPVPGCDYADEGCNAEDHPSCV